MLGDDMGDELMDANATVRSLPVANGLYPCAYRADIGVIEAHAT